MSTAQAPATAAIRTFAAPRRYLQGAGALDLVGAETVRHGRTPVLYVDAGVSELISPRVHDSMSTADLRPTLIDVTADTVTRDRISRAHRQAPASTDVVVGVGGGATIDVAKGVADLFSVPFISVPTIASNDGPTAAIYAMYDKTGTLSELGRMADNPASVIVDTALIASAPTKFLIAGIGDALSKRFEAHACSRGTGLTTQGTRPLAIGEIVANGCADTILQCGEAAVSEAALGTPGPAFEAVIEAVVLQSGIGYENGGLSIAHCMTRGLQTGRGSSSYLHGFHVGYGLLVQLALEGYDDDLRARIRAFLVAVGLPIRLGDLGMADPTDAELTDLAAAAAAAPHTANTWVVADTDSIRTAIDVVEREGAHADV
ncbi:iron-containing alcohol dehydrogenase [Gordonia zhaorongruii]|uniref:iron-containing alcohol dehydrogenase n=1 Tax=Gordonia zhaorongruii TaxID=2597659 RepID=UPI001F23696E|nr:iron-containing alcohol dehydrogenase [Gordonia zhaorongruii]